jgi:D-3-phosphoglycerate dehydrogenase
MYKVLLTDNITPRALEVFDSYENINPHAVGTLAPEDLSKELAGCHAVIVRSPTRVTAAALEKATRLKYIGRA